MFHTHTSLLLQVAKCRYESLFETEVQYRKCQTIIKWIDEWITTCRAFLTLQYILLYNGMCRKRASIYSLHSLSHGVHALIPCDLRIIMKYRPIITCSMTKPVRKLLHFMPSLSLLSLSVLLATQSTSDDRDGLALLSTCTSLNSLNCREPIVWLFKLF